MSEGARWLICCIAGLLRVYWEYVVVPQVCTLYGPTGYRSVVHRLSSERHHNV